LAFIKEVKMQKIVKVNDHPDVKQVTVSSLNIIEMMICHDYEVVVVLFKDGTAYTLTNFLPTKVVLHGWIEFFKEEDRMASDVVAIYHNHKVHADFSMNDLHSYLTLLELGFNGIYAVYSQLTKQMVYAAPDTARSSLRQKEAMMMFIEKTGYNPAGKLL
jgi:hypothetical protein